MFLKMPKNIKSAPSEPCPVRFRAVGGPWFWLQWSIVSEPQAGV